MWRKLVQGTYRRKHYQAKPLGEVYDHNIDGKHAFFLGALAQVWTGIEDSLDAWIEMIHANGGAEKIQSALPPNLDRELDYLSEALKVGLVKAEDAAETGRLIQEIHRIKTFRHNLVHGVIIDIDATGRLVCEHSKVRGSARVRSRTTYTRAQRLRHYERTYNLASDLRLFLFGH